MHAQRRPQSAVTEIAPMLRTVFEVVYASLSWQVTEPPRSIGARYLRLCRWMMWPGAAGISLATDIGYF